MRKLLLLTFVLIVLCTGCGKEETGCMGVKPEDEDSKMLAYAAANNLSVTKHSSGIYYNIVDSGYGAKAAINSKISVTYTGKLLSGTTFDSSVNVISFTLGGVIEGWQIGIPLIKKGGRIKLIIPSALAYRCNGKDGIPPNSVLYFDVKLIDVQ